MCGITGIIDFKNNKINSQEINYFTKSLDHRGPDGSNYFINNDKKKMLALSDEYTYENGGQGGFEIRTWVAIAGACEGAKGNLWCYEPIPDYAVGCTIAKMEIK